MNITGPEINSGKSLVVDAWVIEVPEKGEPGCASMLSEAEREKACRFKFEKDRDAFLFRRMVLRKILSRYYGIPAKDLVFVHNENGKPRIFQKDDSRSSWEFNFSHSQNLAVLALTRDHEIGIDVECTAKKLSDLYDILRIVCVQSEMEQFLKLPTELHQYAFYKIWTTKEAYLKELGTGLSKPPDSIHLDIRQTGQREIKLKLMDQGKADWQFLSFVPCPDYFSTLGLRSCEKVKINRYFFQG